MLIERRVSNRKLHWMRLGAGVSICIVGSLGVSGAHVVSNLRVFGYLLVVAPAVVFDSELGRRFRYGYRLALSETHVLIANGQPEQAYAFADIEKVIHRDEVGYCLVLKDRSQLTLPYGRELDPLDPVYESC